MGGTAYESASAAARAATRASTGTSAFTYTDSIKSGKHAAVAHESLLLKNKPFRECRDNEDNPVSVPIVTFIDLTGSMGSLSHNIIADLHKLVKAVQDNGVVKYPSLLFGGVGDAKYDRAALQVGEFENNDELVEKHLSNIFIEGGGGGNATESYELAIYFAANQIQSDHWDKRGQKGFFFLISDENLSDRLVPSEIKELCGIDVQETPSFSTVVQQLLDRYHVTIIRPKGSSYYDDPRVTASFEKYFPSQTIIKVEDWHEVVGVMATTISILSGEDLDTAVKNSKKAGLAVNLSSTALASLAGSGASLATVPTEDGVDGVRL